MHSSMKASSDSSTTMAVLLIVVLIAAGVATYFALHKKKGSDPPPSGGTDPPPIGPPLPCGLENNNIFAFDGSWGGAPGHYLAYDMDGYGVHNCVNPQFDGSCYDWNGNNTRWKVLQCPGTSKFQLQGAETVMGNKNDTLFCVAGDAGCAMQARKPGACAEDDSQQVFTASKTSSKCQLTPLSDPKGSVATFPSGQIKTWYSNCDNCYWSPSIS